MISKFTPIRLSHLGASQGVGSIVRDKSDYTAVVVDTRFWGVNVPESLEPIRNVRRIQRCLQVSKDLFLPPTGNEQNEADHSKSIPAVLFPRYFECPGCGRMVLNALDNFNPNVRNKMLCNHCDSSVPLKQGIYCNIDELGHLGEVNWQWLVHRPDKNDTDEIRECLEKNHNDNLVHLRKSGKEFIKCMECPARIEFNSHHVQIRLSSPQPWIYERLNYNEGAQLATKVVEISDPQVYTPVLDEGIVIPPESNNDEPTDVLAQILKYSDVLDSILSSPTSLLRKSRIRRLANDLEVSTESVNEALLQYQDPTIDKECEHELLGSPGQMLQEEYDALTTEQTFSKAADFITKHQTKRLDDLKLSVSENLKPYASVIGQLVRVDRLRKVQIFKGFHRLRPQQKEEEDGTKETPEPTILPPDIIGESHWLPAIELFGEGLFLTLNPSWLIHWENLTPVVKRAQELALRFEASGSYIQVSEISPRFLLLHTLAHLMIRELENNCGYPAASLSERIYASIDDEMCGFLIYTAVADVAGSLGGLMEQAEPKNILALLEGVFNHAKWCTLDPVCSEHTGQGRDGLNLAACHGCCLIPDTSCDYGNVLLDRTLIKGDEVLGIPELEKFIKDMADE
ncbi:MULTISPECIES: DUF1998 domain-containing protein [Shewanella]|uniref:DUF1998 domain-containing protein n=1 Tax=Shewanella marisflavi TaxID=260364 RepID=A0ABX5WL04_9GAMM|nr:MULTISPECIES: DUF1998 domain-containing protein [Shewanella]QDF75258.1 DUF1998 domain-containing protein [Shewanella marisflavi]